MSISLFFVIVTLLGIIINYDISIEIDVVVYVFASVIILRPTDKWISHIHPFKFLLIDFHGFNEFQYHESL